MACWPRINKRMPDGQPLTGLLASFVVGTPSEAIPAAVVEPAKNLILDTVGVALAASARSVGKIVIRYVAGSAGATATATVLGAGIKAPMPMAALANGTLANALDFDEGSHLSTHILPVALAVAEHRGVSGKQTLDAFILAYEAGARLTQAIDFRRRENGGPTHRGWWHVGLVGPVAAAMTASRLLRLDTLQTATAIGIASCSSGGFRRNMGTMAKALHSGQAAHAGIEAAMLAQSGFTADSAIIEAPLGFLHAVVLPEDRDVTAITERLGRPYVLEAPLRLKRYPACNPAHPLIDASLRLLHEGRINFDAIESIEADLRPFSLLRREPRDEESAGFSGAFLIAAALIHGTLTLSQISDQAVRDPRVTALMRLIRHVPAGKPETMVVLMRDGRRESVEIRPASRLSGSAAIFEKFDQCARPVVGWTAAEILKAQIGKLEELPDLGGLMAAAAGPPFMPQHRRTA
jgi:2-methylcitrate dehydratase PrpD